MARHTVSNQASSNRMQRLLQWVGRLGNPGVVSTFTTGVVVLAMRGVGLLEGSELALYDQMMRLRPDLPQDERVLVVGINETDIQTRKEWPIEDTTISELLAVLLAANPRAVGLDIFRDVPIGGGYEALQAIIQNDPRVVTVCKISSPDNPGVPPPEGVPASQVGFSDLIVDPGGILRRTLLIAQPPEDALNTTAGHLCNDAEAQLFAFSLQLALRYLAAEGIEPEVTPDQEIKLEDTVFPRLTADIGGYHNVEASGYQLLLDFRAAQDAVSEVSLTAVLSGQVAPELIRDRIVLIGATTPEANDNFYTPFSGGRRDSQQMTGVMIHAQGVSQILSAVLDDRPLLWSWAALTEGFWIISWGVVGAVFAGYIKRPINFSGGMILLLGSLYGISYVLFLQGGWVPIVPAGLAIAFAAGGVVLLDRFNESDYGQAVYQQVKSLLRIDIEIDESKVGQQVAEITETDYFSTLQQRARHLRQQRNQSVSFSEDLPDEAAASPRPPTPPETMDDYLEGLKRTNRRAQSVDSEPQDSDK